MLKWIKQKLEATYNKAFGIDDDKVFGIDEDINYDNLGLHLCNTVNKR